MTSALQLSPEQEHALQLMLSGKNVFLTGEAGTGKSTILRKFREQSTRECVFLAPTGIAAINVGGATLHSFFMLKPGLLTPDSIEEIGSLIIIALSVDSFFLIANYRWFVGIWYSLNRMCLIGLQYQTHRNIKVSVVPLYNFILTGLGGKSSVVPITPS